MAVNDIEARRIIATHAAAPGRMPKRNGVEGKRITLSGRAGEGRGIYPLFL